VSANLISFLYLISGIFFILALRGLSNPESARRGNYFGIIGMIIASATTILITPPSSTLDIILLTGGITIGGSIGLIIAKKIAMTAMPQLVAAFHSLVGLAAVLVASAALYVPSSMGIGSVGNIHLASLIEMGLGVIIGAITFSGSIIAFLKLQGLMSGSPIVFPKQHLLNLLIAIAILSLLAVFTITESHTIYWTIVILSLLIGFLIIIPIGGADMPVVVSMLNSYSGWAAAGIGFTLGNIALIITGALVGSSGAILSYIMCKGMNRSFFNVILGGFGGESNAASGAAVENRPVKQGSADDAAFIMKNAGSIIIVPGYGMAVAQAQHALREMVDILKESGVKVSYAIHPVAGRMPGHMNVLLAEAQVPYDEVFELEDINSQFSQTDVTFVIGANDVTNPAAKTDKDSPIYGMPILDVERSGTILFLKRSLASGYAGVENELFFRDNTMMLFGDAKKMVEDIVKAF
jgi:NAD(P) transhydrogenase subunit beta